MTSVHTVNVRLATREDAGAIARIYNEGIADRMATFETRLRTADDIAGWFDGPIPVVTAVLGGAVEAFASTSLYRQRDCYSGVKEFSVYVSRAGRGRGLGHAVMLRLIEEARAAGAWKLLSRIFPENEASRALCRRLGFREVGTYYRHGKLDGEWRDVVIVELLLDEA